MNKKIYFCFFVFFGMIYAGYELNTKNESSALAENPFDGGSEDAMIEHDQRLRARITPLINHGLCWGYETGIKIKERKVRLFFSLAIETVNTRVDGRILQKGGAGTLHVFAQIDGEDLIDSSGAGGFDVHFQKDGKAAYYVVDISGNKWLKDIASQLRVKIPTNEKDRFMMETTGSSKPLRIEGGPWSFNTKVRAPAAVGEKPKVMFPRCATPFDHDGVSPALGALRAIPNCPKTICNQDVEVESYENI